MPSKGTYLARGFEKYNVATTQTFNIDNGAGATIDEVVICLPYAIEILHARIIYQEATDTAGVASANVKIGTAAAGEEIVAATAYEVSKAVGGYTAMTLVNPNVPANTGVFVRHTGIAATEGGQASVQIAYRIKPF